MIVLGFRGLTECDGTINNCNSLKMFEGPSPSISVSVPYHPWWSTDRGPNETKTISHARFGNEKLIFLIRVLPWAFLSDRDRNTGRPPFRNTTMASCDCIVYNLGHPNVMAPLKKWRPCLQMTEGFSMLLIVPGIGFNSGEIISDRYGFQFAGDLFLNWNIEFHRCKRELYS